MRWIKYIISFCIIFIGFLIIGESHIFYLDNFYTRYSNTTLYLQSGTTSEEMVNDIINSAERNEVQVFTFIKSHPSFYLSKYDIYGTSSAEKYINENSNIFKGEYKSLFLGNINFKFNDIRNIQGIENIHDYYVIGSKENIHQFKMDLIAKYAGNHPKQGYIDKESRNNTIAVWILIITIILLLSFYNIISQKKENVIRISMGEEISKIIWNNILLDSLIFVVIFIGVLSALSKYTYVFFNIKISIISFIILLCINGLLNLDLYFYDIKKVFSNEKGSKNLLSLNYGLKLVTTIITILIISSNMVVISECYGFYKQRSFFKEHSDYNYINFKSTLVRNSDGSINDSLGEIASVQAPFYREFFEKFHATTLKNISDFLQSEGVLANKNAYKYLSSKIDELRDIDLDKEIYFLLPKNMKGNSEIINTLKAYIKFNEGDNFIYDYDVIYYNDNIDIVGIDRDIVYGSESLKNPVIIYNNLSADKVKIQNNDINQDVRRLDYLKDTIYKISSDEDLIEFNKFLAAHNLQYENVNKTNALEKYENSWIIAKRILYINLVFSILILLLEVIIINSIIRLEYEVNAIELSIKKVLGYSILEKNSKIILMTVITTILSILIAIIIAIIMKLNEAYYLALGGFIILILELTITTLYIHKIENSKIQKILKGGTL